MTVWADFVDGHMDGVLMPLPAAWPTFYANVPPRVGSICEYRDGDGPPPLPEPAVYERSERRVQPSPTGEIVFRYRLR